jgi:hypothetical protein
MHLIQPSANREDAAFADLNPKAVSLEKINLG